MTLNLGTDLEKELEAYPQIVERLPELLREQIKLEKWREKRSSSQDREFAESIVREAAESELSREESSRNLRDAAAEINSQIGSDND